MRKVLVAFLAMVFLLPSIVEAAGTCTAVNTTPTRSIRLTTVSCTADASAATYPDTTLSLGVGWVYLAETNPGTTAPTDNYDIVLNNAAGIDVMGGALSNRDTANTERAVPVVSGWVDGPITMVTSNNAVNSATFVLKIWTYQAE